MTGTTEDIPDHEGHISRLEGIIEEIRTRLTSVEIELRSLKHTIWAGLVFIIGLLVKIAFFN